MKIVFVRHPECTANVDKVYGGEGDYPLSSRGEEQIPIISERVKRIVFANSALLFSSPLQRCTSLAYAIADSVIQDNRLKEICLGEFEGKTYEQLQHLQTFQSWCEDPIYGLPPNGESMANCRTRIQPFLEERLAEQRDCIVVTHGGIIRVCLLHLLGLSNDSYFRFFVEIGSITEIEIVDGYAYLKNLMNEEILG